MSSKKNAKKRTVLNSEIEKRTIGFVNVLVRMSISILPSPFYSGDRSLKVVFFFMTEAKRCLLNDQNTLGVYFLAMFCFFSWRAGKIWFNVLQTEREKSWDIYTNIIVLILITKQILDEQCFYHLLTWPEQEKESFLSSNQCPFFFCLHR